MGGWKTWTGGIGMILSGGALIATALASDPVDFVKVAEGIALISAGLAAIGVGFKIEKNGRASG